MAQAEGCSCLTAQTGYGFSGRSTECPFCVEDSHAYITVATAVSTPMDSETTSAKPNRRAGKLSERMVFIISQASSQTFFVEATLSPEFESLMCKPLHRRGILLTKSSQGGPAAEFLALQRGRPSGRGTQRPSTRSFAGDFRRAILFNETNGPSMRLASLSVIKASLNGLC